MKSIPPKYEEVIRNVEKPSRYIGAEYGSLDFAEKQNADYRAVMVYPDTYEIGQANQAVAIVADALNSDEHIVCERAFLPWVDMLVALRQAHLPLVTLESFTPIHQCDFVGITLPHELCATNVLEFLDISDIPIRAHDRGADDPIVFAGGPCAYNPEPFHAFFDVFFIGEGEHLDLHVALLHRKLRDEGASREEILHALSTVPGVYVPSMYDVHSDADGERVHPRFEDVPAVVQKAVVPDLNETKVLPRQVVPYMQLIHDRLNIEVLRGCARGCRFCQAGMIYRPVRERDADSIMEAAAVGFAQTGYDELSLTSLSSTDHSQIESILRRLNRRFGECGMRISLPSQRVDAFGVELAALVAGSRKTGLTLAPEAGTQRMRDCINKGVTEEDIFVAVQSAFKAGWRRLKLYFMIGLPTETDEDVAGIGDLCKRVRECAQDAVPDKDRSKVRISVSVALFIPKPMTPFQWCGQIGPEEIEHRIDVLRASMPKKGIDLHWHDAETSYVEAALARLGRDGSKLIEAAWKNGAHFDAWTEQFNYDAWIAASDESGVDLHAAAMREFEREEKLPWSHISCGVSDSFLRDEYERALRAQTTGDCTFGSCSTCGVCSTLKVSNKIVGERS